MSDDNRFRIKNWTTRQSLRPDVKGPGPWIKIYKTILSNRKIAMLSDAEFGRLVKMWLLAAMETDTWGELPIEPDFLRKVCMMDKNPNLETLEKAGLIESVNGTLTIRTRDVDDPCPQGRAGQDNTIQNKAEDSCSDSGESEPGENQPIKTTDIKAGEMCRLLAQGMVDNDPKARLPKTEQQKSRWIGDMEKIHRLDGRDWLVIRSVIVWCQEDDFWRSNILSPGKLRKQFPALVLAIKRNPAKSKAESREKRNREVMDNSIRKAENVQSDCSTDGGSGNLRSGDDPNQDGRVHGSTRRIQTR